MSDKKASNTEAYKFSYTKETSIIIRWRSYIFLKQALSQLQDLTSVIQF